MVAVLLGISAACAKQDLASELDGVRSWTSTTALAVDRRAAGAIDRAVAVQLADRAEEARTRSAKSLDQLAASDSERTLATAVLDSLRDGISRLRAVAP